MKKNGILAVAVLLFTLVLSSCGTKTPTATAEEFMTILKSGDTSKISTVYDGEVDLLSMFSDSAFFSEQVLAAIYERMTDFSFKVTSESIDTKTTATVAVDITAYALGDATTSAMETILQDGTSMLTDGASEQDVLDFATSTYEAALKQASKTYTTTIQLHLTMVDSAWMVDNLATNQTFSNAILGNLIEASNALVNSTSY